MGARIHGHLCINIPQAQLVCKGNQGREHIMDKGSQGRGMAAGILGHLRITIHQARVMHPRAVRLNILRIQRHWDLIGLQGVPTTTQMKGHKGLVKVGTIHLLMLLILILRGKRHLIRSILW